MRAKYRNLIGVCTAGLLASNAANASTTVLPYNEEFNGTSSNFTPSGTAPLSASSWTIGGGTYTNLMTAQQTTASLVQATGFVANQNFVMSTTFTVTDLATTFTVGFAALATGANLQATGVNYYLADIAGDGGLRIGSFTGSTFSSATPFVASTATSLGALTVTDMVTLTLTGTYTGSNLVLSLSASKNGGAVSTVTTGNITGASTGNYFGLRNRDGATAGSSDTVSVSFDNFSFSQVPEPGSLILLGAGALGMVVRRRR